MFFLTFVGVLIAVYVYTFKDDFTKEHIEKAVPFIVILIAGLFLLGVLTSLVGR